MVYEKYIKRGGKIYGPYSYKSVKKDGRVITEYLGKSEKKFKKLNKNFTGKLIFFGFVFLIIIVASFFFNFDFIGKVTMSFDDLSYSPGEIISGNLKLVLEQNEFIPASAKVLIDNAGEKHEFVLEELIDHETSEGDFYISNKNISGFGKGYGFDGSYPIVSFVLNIFSELPENESVVPSQRDNSGEPSGGGGGGGSVETSEEIIEEDEEEQEQEEAEEQEQEQNEEEQEQEQEENKEERKEEKEEKEKPKKEKSITGKIIQGFFKGISNFFLPLTGKVSLELEKQVFGEVSKDKPFVYDLEEDQILKINSSDHKVNLLIVSSKNDSGEQLIVTTDYVGKGIELYVDLSRLNITRKVGDLEIRLVYEGIEISSVIKEIKIVNITDLENVTEINETLLNITNITRINLTVDTMQDYFVVINEPVKWVKKIKLQNKSSNIVIEIPLQANEIYVEKVEDKVHKNIDKVKIEGVTLKRYNSITGNIILVSDPNVVADSKTSFLVKLLAWSKELFSKMNIAGKTIAQENNSVVESPRDDSGEPDETLENITIENETLENITSIINETIQNITIENETIENIISITNETVDNVSVIEDELEEIIIQENALGEILVKDEFNKSMKIIIEDKVDEINIEYETPAPQVVEEEIEKGKRVTVSSDIHYEEILTYTSVPDVPFGGVKLYEIVNGTQKLVDNVYVRYFDMNNNDLVDKIQWITPSLSEKVYELEYNFSKPKLKEKSRFWKRDLNDNKIADDFDEIIVRYNSGKSFKVKRKTGKQILKMGKIVLEEKEFELATENVEIILTLSGPVSSQDVEIFEGSGGEVMAVLKHTTNAITGKIPINNLDLLKQGYGGKLEIIDFSYPSEKRLFISSKRIRVRPIVWQTYGYNGSSDHSIASIDTGIDTTHPDLFGYDQYGFTNASAKVINWYDSSADASTSPRDYDGHGTASAAGAAGLGASWGTSNATNITVTFSGLYPDTAGYAYVDTGYIKSIGNISLNMSHRDAGSIWIRSRYPNNTNMPPVLGTETDTSSPANGYLNATYSILTGDPLNDKYSFLSGQNAIALTETPFSTLETYPMNINNTDGYNVFMGMAPNTKLVGVKVATDAGSATAATIEAGIDWVVGNKSDSHIKVMTIQYGTSASAISKIESAIANGIVVVDACGNDGPTGEINGGSLEEKLIVVCAINRFDEVTDYSSVGPAGSGKPDVLAYAGSNLNGSRTYHPDTNWDDGYDGGANFADRVADDYGTSTGTSRAAPAVAGLVALMIEAMEDTTGYGWDEDAVLTVKQILGMTAIEVNATEGGKTAPLNRGDKDTTEGYGLVQGDAAMEAILFDYTITSSAQDTFGSEYNDKRVWARKISLDAPVYKQYVFNLTVPAGADYDLYIYDDDYVSSTGDPIILNKSITAGASNESITLAGVTTSGWVVVKRVSGSGEFNLTSELRTPAGTCPEEQISGLHQNATWCYFVDAGDPGGASCTSVDLEALKEDDGIDFDLDTNKNYIIQFNSTHNDTILTNFLSLDKVDLCIDVAVWGSNVDTACDLQYLEYGTGWHSLASWFGCPGSTGMRCTDISGNITTKSEAENIEIYITADTSSNAPSLQPLDIDALFINLTYTFGPIPETVNVKLYPNVVYTDSNEDEEYKFYDEGGIAYLEAIVTDVDNNILSCTDTTANMTLTNGTVADTITLTYNSTTSSYRGNWTTTTSDINAVYLVNITSTNLTSKASGVDYLHLYSGENVSAYRMDWDEDGSNESILENKHLVAVFDEGTFITSPLIYIRQKDENVSYNFLSSFYINSTDKVGISSDEKELVLNYTSILEGENIDDAYLLMSSFTSDYTPGLNSTLRTCSVTWGADCSLGTDTEADNTMDSCSNNGGEGWSTGVVREVYVDTTVATLGQTIIVNCELYNGNNAGFEYYIYYTNGSGWTQKGSGTTSASVSGVNYSTTFAVDNVVGTHWIRCIHDFNGEDDECADVGANYDNDDANFTVSSRTLKDQIADLNITMRTEDVDYLVYNVTDFNASEIPNLIFSDLTGKLGSSVSDDRYHVGNGTDALVSSAAKKTWTGFSVLTPQQSYIAIYDNSTSDDSVDNNVIGFVHFENTSNPFFKDVGIWNETGREGTRIRYDISSATASDYLTYLLVFSTGTYNTIDQWMSTIITGAYPTTNFMTSADSTPPSVTINSPTSTTYSDSSILFNVTATDSGGVNSCWYSIDSGATNTTLENIAGTNYYNATNSSVPDGGYTAQFYCNDAAGNLNNTESVNFIIDLIAPTISFVSPTPTDGFTTTNTSVYLNVTIIDTTETSAWIDWNKSLVGYWNFDFTNSTGVYDNSSNNNFGLFNGANFGTENITTAKRGKGLDFDGVDDSITASSLDAYASGKSQLTISSWVKYSLASPNDRHIAGWWNFKTANLKANGAKLRFSLHAGGNPFVTATSSANYDDNNWHHVVGTYDENGGSGNVKLYVDGIEVINTTTTGTIDTTDAFTIGGLAIASAYTIDGNLDEVLIFDRALNSDEIKALYDNSANRLFRNFTSLSDGLYNYSVGVIDSVGNLNTTSPDRQITIDTTANNAPNNPSPSLFSIDGTNKTTSDLNCSAIISDPDSGDLLNVSIKWYKNDVLDLTIDYNNSYSNATLFNAILDSGNTTKAENWICGMRLYDGTDYSSWVNSSNLTILNAAPTISLTSPTHGTKTTNRSPEFTWSGSDNDSDTLSYEINLTAYYTGGGRRSVCDIYEDNNSLGSSTSYIPSDYLRCLIDNNYYFNWTVRAWDGEEFGSWTTERNLSIQSNITISLPTSLVSFGSMNISDTNDTTDESPPPLILINNGNAELNISINFTNLWSSVSNPSNYFRYKIRNLTTQCFISGETSTSWTQAPFLTGFAIHRLNFTSGYQTGCNNVSVDLLIDVPGDESTGDKSSAIIFISSLGEPGFGAD